MLTRLRHHTMLAAALALCGIAANASAQESGFAASGVVAFGVDRLFGVLRTSVNVEQGGAESTTSATDISFLTFGSTTSPYAVPRLTFDGFVTDGLSLGGLFGVASQSSESEMTAGGTTMTVDGPSETMITVGGRVGYAHMLSDVVGIWPKLGLTYFTDSIDNANGGEIDSNGLALSADVMLLIAPVAHFGFTIGPVLDLGLTGSTDLGMTSVDTKVTDFGLLAGVAGWL